MKRGTQITPLRTSEPLAPLPERTQGRTYNTIRMPKPEPFDREPAGEIDGVPVYRVPVGARRLSWA